MQPNQPTPNGPASVPSGSPSSSAPAPDSTPAPGTNLGPAPTPATVGGAATPGTGGPNDPRTGEPPATTTDATPDLPEDVGDPVAVEGPDGVHRLTVGDGESLALIAEREDVDPAELYRANAAAIEAAAQGRGFGGSDNGRLLFAGTTLDLPSR